MAIYLDYVGPVPFISELELPLPNLGFSLAGFTSFHLGVAAKLVSVAPWGFLSTRDIPPPLRTPPYLGLSLPLAQSLPPSQAVRAWTFLYLTAAAIRAGLLDVAWVAAEPEDFGFELPDAIEEIDVPRIGLIGIL